MQVKFALHHSKLINWMNPEVNASTSEASAAQLVKIVEDRTFAETKPKDADAAPYFRVRGTLGATSTECSTPSHGAELWADTARILGLDPNTIVSR